MQLSFAASLAAAELVPSNRVCLDVLHVPRPPLQLAHADVKMDCLEATCTGNTTSYCTLNSDSQISEAMQSLSNGAAFVPLAAPFWSRLEQVREPSRA